MAVARRRGAKDKGEGEGAGAPGQPSPPPMPLPPNPVEPAQNKGSFRTTDLARVLEKPLPKPSDESYVEARLLEALVEARLAFEFLSRGLTRNAAWKAFQAWRALLAALLRLERDRLMQAAKSEEERRWIAEKAIPRVPTSRMKALSRMLEELGHADISLWTDRALHLHDYQYHGPDPDAALSKYQTPQEAAYDVKKLVNELVRRVESLRGTAKWSQAVENALKELKSAS